MSMQVCANENFAKSPSPPQHMVHLTLPEEIGSWMACWMPADLTETPVNPCVISLGMLFMPEWLKTIILDDVREMLFFNQYFSQVMWEILVDKQQYVTRLVTSMRRRFQVVMVVYGSHTHCWGTFHLVYWNFNLAKLGHNFGDLSRIVTL